MLLNVSGVRLGEGVILGEKKERKTALGNSYFKSKAAQGDKDPREAVSCGEPLLLSSVALGAVLFLLVF